MKNPPRHAAQSFSDLGTPDGIARSPERQAAETAKRSPLMGGINLARWAEKAPPEIPWIVPGWIPSRAVTLLYGAGGVGKSYLALQAAVAAQVGAKWLGLPIEQCPALYLSCEDDEAVIVRRLSHVARHYETDLAALAAGGLRVFDRVGLDNSLFDFEDFRAGSGEPSALLAQMMNAALDARARLVVIDSAHNTFIGNENIRVQVEAYMRTLRSLATEIDGAVIVLAHPSRAGMNSGALDGGSTSWHALARGRLTLEKSDEVPGLRVLRSAKQNHAEEGEPIDLRWSEPGLFVRADAPGGMVGSIVRRNAETAFLDCLKELNDQGQHVGPYPKGHYAPRVMTKMGAAAGFKLRDLEGAMSRLMEAGKVVLDTYGPPSRKKQYLAIPVENPPPSVFDGELPMSVGSP